MPCSAVFTRELPLIPRNTLLVRCGVCRYASDAARIENKPIINADPTASQNVRLRCQVRSTTPPILHRATSKQLLQRSNDPCPSPEECRSCCSIPACQVQELRGEVGRLYASGADGSPNLLETYAIGVPSHGGASRPASAATSGSAPAPTRAVDARTLS